MNFDDLFKPYSPELRGELESYLKNYNGRIASNHFFGSEYFFVIRDKGLIVPDSTFVRVSRSPAPDRGYIVDSDFMLKSGGIGHMNMSLIGAEKGVYDPVEILENMHWSILRLKV